MDTRSMVTKFQPEGKILKYRKFSSIAENYQVVTKRELKIPGKNMVEAESRRIRKNMTMPINERGDIKSLLGVDWLRELKWTIRNIESTTTKTDQSEKEKKINRFEKIFKTNRRTKTGTSTDKTEG